MNNINFCTTPFAYLETHYDGNISICCPSFTDFCYVGNIYENSFEEIWNGEKAIALRQSILDGNYKHCKLGLCKYEGDIKKQDKIKMNPCLKKYPRFVFFCHDRQCNVKCIMCRDEQILTDKEKEEHLNSMIEPYFLPMLKDAQMVSFNGGGEFFASNHMKLLAQSIAKKYPNIGFQIISNGLLFNKKNCDSIGITDKIKVAEISLHAATEETYNKIVKGSNFSKVMDNIKWLASQRKENKISLMLNFVITEYNYEEMPKFQELANELNCIATYTTYIPWNSELSKHYDEVAIFEPKHKRHKNFIKVIKNPIFNSKNCKMQNSLIKIRNDSIKPIWKKFI